METLTFRRAVEIEVARLQAAHPILADAIGRAHALLVDGRVFPHDDGMTATVGSSKDPLRSYHVNSHCTCKASEFRDEPCKHRLAFRLYQRVVDRLTEEEERWTVDLDPEPVAPVGIDEKYVVVIQGTRFAKVAGLLALAHARGLQSLTTTFTYNDAELAIAQSTAVFPFGSFTDVGDAAPSNTNPKVRAHFRRVAATRATARALRLALNVDMCSVEELEVSHG